MLFYLYEHCTVPSLLTGNDVDIAVCTEELHCLEAVISLAPFRIGPFCHRTYIAMSLLLIYNRLRVGQRWCLFLAWRGYISMIH